MRLQVMQAGFMLWGYPSSPNNDYAAINPLGQFIGALIMFGLLGFLPGFTIAKILSVLGQLRVPKAIEIAGLDLGEIHTRYREKIDVEQAVRAEERVK